MRYHELVTEMPARRKKADANPYPNDRSRDLRDGRSLQVLADIFPKSGERFQPVGEPHEVAIADLDLHPDGLGTAKTVWYWKGDHRHENTKPISVINHDGQLHVLDGYHRVVQAAKDGRETILVQEVE